jgi:N-hydroxyarylamine O-acetyltransferase
MKASNFDLQQYFDRIGYKHDQGSIGHHDQKVGIGQLTDIMRGQLFSVPFENTEVQAGFVPSMVPEQIVTKIVERKRGGYCYEVNGIFAMALTDLSIPYYFVAARPMFYPTRRPKTHMAIVAQVDGQDWLCDLGFGSYGIRAPFPMEQLESEVQQDHDTFMITKTSEREYCLQAKVDGKWANQYGFDLYPQEWVDFAPANFMNATHPDAMFVQKLLIVQHHIEGRTIFFGRTLKTNANGVTHNEVIPEVQVKSLVLKEFGLALPYTPNH